ncbi:pantoate--beta-alanine ligase [Actinoallomurus rhizosphaericola]|uniref:pantoate--beta-alanine ligase n=1 Tax=Actinoallomurus rhizosphaericola TaxID=2952536 RepID=UPI00209007A8|nr:pantoate--beta-alanine ligase [Actinoallomurus rhizosphaericola]MCO5994399.1 pantoate--beta-alanine ligase [Actinoallomurus rhizosphaericola]
MTPIIARTREELTAARATQGTLALVPTMGALHEGHRSLLRRARELADTVAVSIFVNPLQFGPNEDLDRYPRTLPDDIEICAAEGVDLVFAPTVDVMYPPTALGARVTVDSGPMGTVVEGACRPGHFDGVLTVVLKLFNLVRPDVAVFGEKDAQQLAVIRRMVADLNVPVRIVGSPTVREADGLALSSRNRYLSAAERLTAVSLSMALRAGAEAVGDGPAKVVRAARTVLDGAIAADPPLELDYLVLVDPETFQEVDDAHTGPAVLAVAGRVGTTHLIDNVPLLFGPASE